MFFKLKIDKYWRKTFKKGQAKRDDDIFCGSRGAKADPGPAHRALVLPFGKKKLGVVFVNFYSITHIYFKYSNMQCLQFVFCSLLSLTTKRQGICEGASKQSQEPKVLKVLKIFPDTFLLVGYTLYPSHTHFQFAFALFLL